MSIAECRKCRFQWVPQERSTFPRCPMCDGKETLRIALESNGGLQRRIKELETALSASESRAALLEKQMGDYTYAAQCANNLAADAEDRAAAAEGALGEVLDLCEQGRNRLDGLAQWFDGLRAWEERTRARLAREGRKA